MPAGASASRSGCATGCAAPPLGLSRLSRGMGRKSGVRVPFVVMGMPPCFIVVMAQIITQFSILAYTRLHFPAPRAIVLRREKKFCIA